jgi:hypothetical protein
MTDLYSTLSTRKSGNSRDIGKGTLTEAVESADQDRSAVDRLATTLPVS